MEFYLEKGISSSWGNQSEEARQAKIHRKRDKQYRNAAQRRQIHPEIPFNPENPYDTPYASAEHMLSTISEFRPQPDSILVSDSEDDVSESDTITVDARLAYGGSMPPPSNQAQGQLSRKRGQSQISTSNIEDIRSVEVRVHALREQVAKKKKAKEYQSLLRIEKQLQIELAELSS